MRKQALERIGQTAKRKKGGDDSEAPKKRVAGAQRMLLSI